MTQFSMGYPNLRSKFRVVQHGTRIWSTYKLTKNYEKSFRKKIAEGVVSILSPTAPFYVQMKIF